MANPTPMGPISFTLNLNSKWGEIALENESSILFYFILSCAHSISFSLLSLAGHRDKLKIKSTRKIIYKKHSQALAFYPYCSVRNSPSPYRERNQCFPPNSLLLIWGRQNSKGKQGWGQQWQTVTNRHCGPGTIWPLGAPLAASPRQCSRSPG